MSSRCLHSSSTLCFATTEPADLAAGGHVQAVQPFAIAQHWHVLI